MSSTSPKEDSVSLSEGPPDRSSSSSAPPALELATESLFAFTVQYANIFSDIRAHEDYYNFYETYGQTKKLPPPLEASPFLFETGEDEEEMQKKRPLAQNQVGIFRINSPQPVLGQFEAYETSIPSRLPPQSNSAWNPNSRNPGLSQEAFSQGRHELLQMNLSESSSFGSSPSAATAFSSAQYIWNDEDPPQPKGLPTVPKAYPTAPYNGIPHFGFGSPFSQPPVSVPGNSGPSGMRGTPSALNGSAPLPPSSLSDESKEERVANGVKELNLKEVKDEKDEKDKDGEGETDGPRSVVCRYFAAGYCSRGDKCFYAHVTTGGAEEDKTTKRKTKSFSRSPAPRPSPAPVPTPVPTASPVAAVPPTRQISPRPPPPYSPREEGEELTNFEQLVGRIYSVSRDQQGCRLLQKKLEEKDSAVIDIIFGEIFDHITELMTGKEDRPN